MPRTPTRTFGQDGSDHSLSHWMHICGLGSQSTSCGSMSSDSCASAGRMTHLLLPICGSNMDSPSLLNQNNAYWPIVDVLILKITGRTSHLSDIPEIPRALGLGASNCKPGPDLFFVFLIHPPAFLASSAASFCAACQPKEVKAAKAPSCGTSLRLLGATLSNKTKRESCIQFFLRYILPGAASRRARGRLRFGP